jgi:hypothetical protein
MKATLPSLLPVLAGAVAVLGLIPAALAHGEDEGHGMSGGPGHGHGGMAMTDADKPLPEDQYPPTYFAHPEHRVAVIGHIALMVLSWVFVLPAGENRPSLLARSPVKN